MMCSYCIPLSSDTSCDTSCDMSCDYFQIIIVLYCILRELECRLTAVGGYLLLLKHFKVFTLEPPFSTLSLLINALKYRTFTDQILHRLVSGVLV